MFVRKIRRKCSVRGCRCLESYAISKTREAGNTIIICKQCLKDANKSVTEMKPNEKNNIPKGSNTEIPGLFFNARIKSMSEKIHQTQESITPHPPRAVPLPLEGKAREEEQAVILSHERKAREEEQAVILSHERKAREEEQAVILSHERKAREEEQAVILSHEGKASEDEETIPQSLPAANLAPFTQGSVTPKIYDFDGGTNTAMTESQEDVEQQTSEAVSFEDAEGEADTAESKNVECELLTTPMQGLSVTAERKANAEQVQATAFMCSDCGKVFGSKKGLKSHLRYCNTQTEK